MIGCHANQSNAKDFLGELREGMWQQELDELEQLMRSRGVVLLGVRSTGGGAAGQERDYRLRDKVLRVQLAYPVLRLGEPYRDERYVSYWKFVDLEAEKRQEKEWEKEFEKTWGKMDPATLTRIMAELSRQNEAKMRKLFRDWPNAKERPTTQVGRPGG